jgi:hypothetical protein
MMAVCGGHLKVVHALLKYHPYSQIVIKDKVGLLSEYAPFYSNAPLHIGFFT